MKKEVGNIPELRFSEFNDEWKRLPLQQLCSKTISYGIVQTGESDAGEIPCVRVVDLTKDSLSISAMIKTTKSISDSYSKTVLKKDEIMFALRGEIGLVKLVPKCLVGGNLTRGLARLAAQTSIVQPEFLFWSILTPRTIKNLKQRVNGSALKEIPLLELRKVTVLYTEHHAEQQKIASFLTAVDKKIEQLTRKKGLLEQYKKGVMQKIFSQEIRFKDDNGQDYPDWGVEQLKEIAEIIGGGTPDTSIPIYWEGEVTWFTPTEIGPKFITESKRKISEVGLKKSSARLLPKGTILFTSRATIAEISFANRKCTTNQGFQSLIINLKNDAEYIYYFIKQFKKDFIRKAQGSTFLEINKNEMRKIKVLVPSLKEQRKIGRFLSLIDEKLSSVQTQLTHTKDFKKGLLQKMFV